VAWAWTQREDGRRGGCASVAVVGVEKKGSYEPAHITAAIEQLASTNRSAVESDAATAWATHTDIA